MLCSWRPVSKKTFQEMVCVIRKPQGSSAKCDSGHIFSVDQFIPQLYVLSSCQGTGQILLHLERKDLDGLQLDPFPRVGVDAGQRHRKRTAESPAQQAESEV